MATRSQFDSAAPSFASSYRQKAFDCVSSAAVFALLWLSVIKPPLPPALDLDVSWQMILNHARLHGLQFGQDIVFTYGPLGYLFAGIYHPELFGQQVAWQLISSAVFAGALIHFGRRLPTNSRLAFYLFGGLFGTVYPDAMYMVFLALFGAMLPLEKFRSPPWLISLGAALAVLALVKFTYLFVGGFIVIVACGYSLSRRQPREAILLGGTFAATFLAGWLALGQAISNIPNFVILGWEVSQGYGGAMGSDETTFMLACGLMAGAGVLAYLGLFVLGAEDRLQALVITAIMGAIAFFNWKHGFTRADGHMLAHYVIALLFAAAFPGLCDDRGRFRRAKIAVLSVTVVFSLVGIALILPNNVFQTVDLWNQRVRNSFALVFERERERTKLERATERVTDLAQRHILSEYIGRETVDHLGDDQAYTLLSGFSYHPRPALQGYAAYTEKLNRLNETFYRSAKAPELVIQRVRTIDDRFFPLDDSLTQKLLYQNYTYLGEEEGLLLWERLQAPLAPVEERILQSATFRLGEPVAIPSSPNESTWATIELAPSLLGKIRQFLYKPPRVTIEVTDSSGRSSEYRFIPAMAAAGFIVNPLFTDPADIIGFQNGQAARQTQKLTLKVRPGDEKFFNSTVQLTLRTTTPFRRLTDPFDASRSRRFKMANRRPVKAEAGAPVVDAYIGGKHLLQMHAPSLLSFDAAPATRRVSASFGLMAGAFLGAEGTAGVVFAVDWEKPDGSSERLYSRLLDPRLVAADRESQHLDLALPTPISEGRIVFRTLPGPTGATAFAWAYWTDIQLR